MLLWSFGVSLSGILGKMIDIGLIACVLFAVFTFGKCKGYSEGQLNGYFVGYESFYEKAYFHLRDSLDYERLSN